MSPLVKNHIQVKPVVVLQSSCKSMEVLREGRGLFPCNLCSLTGYFIASDVKERARDAIQYQGYLQPKQKLTKYHKRYKLFWDCGGDTAHLTRI